MAALNCPTWEYNDTSEKTAILNNNITWVLTDLSQKKIDTDKLCRDTRLIHRRVFSRLTPSGYSHFAGHYRGEDFECLKYQNVTIPADPRVGIPATNVNSAMKDLSNAIQESLKILDNMQKDGSIIPEIKLYNIVSTICLIFERFLVIHPYLNGNGHIARYLVWSIGIRYGYKPTGFTVEPRPLEPHYTEAIVKYRNGDKENLEKLILATFIK